MQLFFVHLTLSMFTFSGCSSFPFPSFSISVSYDVLSKSETEMENMMAKSAATFSDSQPFTTEMQKTMTTNNVKTVSPSSITADTTATPSKAGTKGDKPESDYAVTHTIVLQGMTATEFNNDPLIIKSFRQAVANMLEVESTDIINIKTVKESPVRYAEYLLLVILPFDYKNEFNAIVLCPPHTFNVHFFRLFFFSFPLLFHQCFV